ncbi:MAG: hypothetical protein HYV65_03360 [Candidatus Spechtbacteria bacterium]|nr:hypothetical protein [Candidatus Spechtbacteria bacterium]
MKIYLFETRGQYRQGDCKIIFADSEEEARGFLLEDERDAYNAMGHLSEEALTLMGMSEDERKIILEAYRDVPDISDEMLLADWVLVREEEISKGVFWGMGGVMFA